MAAANNETKLSTRKEEVLCVFHHFDANGDCGISGEELGAYLASVGEPMSNDYVTRVISDFDSDGDRLLKFADFVRVVEDRGGGRCYVERGCGFITPVRVAAYARSSHTMSFEECKVMIRKYDLDGIGKLNFQDA